MKKKIIFIYLSVFLMISATIFMALKVYNSSLKTFTKAGYILSTDVNSSDKKSVRYYFSSNTNYKSNYQENVLFKDTNGKSVSVSSSSFVHYNDDAVSLLKKGVILNLDEINSKVPKYYNVFEGTILEKSNGTYFVDNLGKQLKFKNFIVKISENKYMIVSDNIKLKLSDTDLKSINSYIEIDFTEGDVIRLSNQEVTYQTIKEDASLLIGDDIVLNLDSRYFSYKGEDKINLESIIIDSDDNIDIKPKNDTKADTGNDNKNNINSNSDNTDNGNNNNSITGGTVIDGGSSNGGVTSFGDSTEKEVIEDSVTIPSANVLDLDVSSNKIEANIKISDPDSLIVGKMLTTIVENSTGNVIYTKETDAGVYNIDIYLETLTPETSYNITTTATYEKKGITYNVDLINQVVLTESLGFTLDKYYYTSDSLVFKAVLDDYSRVKSCDITLYTSDNERVDSYSFVAGSNDIISFNGLDANTKYTVIVDNILYDNYVISDTLSIEMSAKTLKRRPNIGSLDYSVDKKNSLFNLEISDISDLDSGIESYHYEIYEVLDNSLKLVKTIDKNTKGTVDLLVDGVNIYREKSYIYRVVVDFYDNEKYIELESSYSSIMIMEGNRPPTIRWQEDKITFERAVGTISISDLDSSIDLNSNIIIEYTDSVGVSNKVTSSGTLNIPFDVNYLKSDETYTVNVLGRLSLDGKNYIDNATLGSFKFKTSKPNSFEATFEQDLENPQYRFRIKNNISSSDDISLESSTLSEISFNLIEGKDTSGKIVKTITKVDNDLREYYSALSDQFINNEFYLDPSFFGFSNNDLSSEYYTIEITGLYDYTRDIQNGKSGNNIPIKNNTFTFRTNDSLPSIPDTPVSYSVIRNKDAGSHYSEKLDPDTIVGIKVKAVVDNSNMNIKTINYYVYDADTDTLLSDYNYVDNIDDDGVIDYVYFWLENGTSYDTVDTKMCRGHSYYFAWNALFDLDHDGKGETNFPYDKSLLKSNTVSISKQAAKIITYPSKSTDNTITFKYIYQDIDNSLYDKNLSVYLSNNADIKGNLASTSSINTTTDYDTVTFDNLSNGYITVSSMEALLKNDNNINEVTYIHQYFESSYTLLDLSYTVMLDTNRIIISINNYQNEITKLSRVAALKLTFNCDGESIVKDFVEINNGLAVVDMIDLASFLGKNITLEVEAYYDNGIMGYDVNSDYYAFQSIKNEYGGGEYYKISANGNLLNSNVAMGSIYSMDISSNSIVLTNKISNKKISMENAPGIDGFTYNYYPMLVKSLDKVTLQGDATSSFKFDKIIPGISLRDDNDNLEIVPGIRTASIRGDFYGVGASSIKDNKVYIQLFSTDDNGINLDEVDTYEFTVDQLNETIELDNLVPKQNYAIKIYAYVSDGNGSYDYNQLYDIDENNSNMTYYFKTLSSISISNITTTYKANSYEDKYILLEFELDRIIGYDKLEYQLFKLDDNLEFVEMETKIDASTIFNNKMSIKIPCSPGSEFEFNKQYKIVITPIVNVTVNSQSQRIELDNPGVYEFTLSKLRSPHIGISSTISSGSDSNSLDFRVTVLDVDKVIVGQNYKINVVDSNGNDVTPSSYVDKEFDVSDVNKKFVVSDLESNMTYIFKVIYNIDSLNNITSTEEVNTTYVSNALNKDAVYLGDVYTANDLDNTNNILLSFYNSYRLTTVDTVRYTIYNSDNGMAYDNEISFVPTLKETADGTYYYVASLPNTFNDSGIYYIQLQFLSSGAVVSETTLEYSYTNK